MKQKYTEKLTINENSDLVTILCTNLDKWQLPSMPNYLGMNIEIYSNKAKTVEIILNRFTRELITTYTA